MSGMIKFEDLSPKAQEGIETFRRYITNLPGGYQTFPGDRSLPGVRARGTTHTIDLNIDGLLYGQLFTLGCVAEDMIQANRFAYQHGYWVK